MNTPKYILRVLSGVRFEKMFTVIDRIHEKSGKNKAAIFFDMINCAIRYGAGYYDYEIFEFYNMNHEHRKTYVTRVKNKKIISIMNDDGYSDIYDSKNKFNKRFEKYLNRDWLDMTQANFEEFEKFVNSKQKEYIFAKPNNGSSGNGIEKIKVTDYKSLKDLYDYLKEKDFGVVEELIVQHKDLQKLYPNSINSYRIVTIVIDNKPRCVYAVCKMGTGGHFVDNSSNGGIFAPIDLENETIANVALSEHGDIFEKHPDTEIELVGYKLPFVKEALELCFKAAMEIEQIKFAGWDIAITESGPVIVEGNDYPSYDFWQLPAHTPNRIGLLPFYKKLIPEL